MHEHISDTDLFRFARNRDALPSDRRAAIEEATARCAVCRTSLDFFAVTAGEEWVDVEPEPKTDWSRDDPLRAYAERIAAEDREADALIDEEKLLEFPMRTAWKNLQRRRRLLTGGVVRRLNAHANDIYQDKPLDALTFADAAISVAEMLPDNYYPWNMVFELRGTAWKERANALLVRGKYPAALEALKHAERAYRNLGSPGFGLSTVALVRASVLYEQGELPEAAMWAEKAEHGFAHAGQEERRMRAVFLRASIRYETGEIANAVSLFEQVLEHGEATTDARWIARASYAIGNCDVDRGNLAEASMRFHAALVIFREIGPAWDRLATEWGLARVVLHGGDPRKASGRLREVAAGYEKCWMLSDAALVKLDLVEALLALGETREIVEIASRLFRVFKRAGMTKGALTAMAYIKEAAAAGRLTSTDLNAVRTFLRRVRREPELTFERPPRNFR